MAFKTAIDYNEERYGNFFILSNDNDYADVIFLYESVKDVLVADVHYVKSADYSGYVHCCGKGCPACSKGLRVQNKLFIPLYNINNQKIEFFDRSTRFDNQLNNDVFSKYSNPSEFVFRITRHGEAGSQDTRYEIKAIAKNSTKPYAKILADHGITKLMDHYSVICKDLTPAELGDLLSSNAGPAPTNEYNYIPTPRATGNVEPLIPEDIPEYETPTVSAPVNASADLTPPADFSMPEPITEGSEAAAPLDTTEEVGEVTF